MLHTISNSCLSVTVSEKGAELQSIVSTDGTEYLWQGDAAYWADRSPNIFPYVGRLKKQTYSLDGQCYTLPIHGFAPCEHFDLIHHSENQMIFQLTDNDAIYRQYPRHFSFQVIYTLDGDRLDVTFQVDNRDEKPMYFGLGGHPGFKVPLEPGLKFEDYRLRFGAQCQPQRILFTPDCFVSGETVDYALENGTDIPLVHNLFDDDAIVLENAARTVTLETALGKRAVTVGYPDMRYIGFWHADKTDAPYVCIEPWSALPDYKDGLTALEEQKDLTCLDAGKQYTNTWWIRIH